MTVWKQFTKNLGGLAKHVVKTVVSEPIEIVKDAVGQNIETGQQSQQNTQQSNGSNHQTGDDLAKAGFKTQSDFNKYQQLSGNKDQMELAVLRKRLHQEQGLDTDLEHGMARARSEYEQKEEERKRVEEKEEEQKKEFEFMKKKQEDAQVVAAKGQSSAESKAWGAG